ncbi:MAG TPA: DUF3108 domain-containing protein [Azospira sp.]|nr:DUF3108 domain-containing protein [Azospira sp.]
MPFALVAAMLASLGLHAAALLLPEVEPAPAPEPAAALQAEIVLRPRAAPVSAAPSGEKAATPPPALPAPPPRPKSAPPVAPPLPEAAASLPPADASAVPVSPAPDGAPATGGDAPAGAASPPTPALDEAAPPLVSPGIPERGMIRYAVYRGDPPTLIGSAEQRWEMGGGQGAGRYRIVSVMETTGVAAWIRSVRLETESRGALVVAGLQPERYSSRRLDGERERFEEVVFDPAAALVRFPKGGSAPLPAGAQDLLSFNYQLGWLARTGDMAIATTRKIGNFRLELLGKEWLETPQQSIWTLRFRASGETTTEVWLATDNHLLPVKIRHIDKKGELFEQVAEDIRLAPADNGTPE